MLKLPFNKTITSKDLNLITEYSPALVLNPKDIFPGDVLTINFKKSTSKTSQLLLDSHKIIVTNSFMKENLWCVEGFVSENDNIELVLNDLLLEIVGAFFLIEVTTYRNREAKESYIKKISFFKKNIESIKVHGRVNFFENKRTIIDRKDNDLEL